MPDLTLCVTEECPKRGNCYRAQATPDPLRQSWARFQWPGCTAFVACDRQDSLPVVEGEAGSRDTAEHATTHTPAVRQVTAWTEIQGREPEDGDWLCATKEAAYEQAATGHIDACLRARGYSPAAIDEWWGNPLLGTDMATYNRAALDRKHARRVCDRWASLLQHLDEKAQLR